MAVKKNREAFICMANALEFEPHPGQIKALEMYLKSRFICIDAGRRWGKSKLMSIPACYTMSAGKTQTIVVSKTYKLAKKVWKYMLVEARNLFGPSLSVDHAGMTMSTPWGASFQLGSADNPDSLLGDGYDLVVMDEAATMKDVIFQQNILPMVRDCKGTISLISTPRGMNWFHDVYEQGVAKQDGWLSYQGSSRENFHVWDDEEWDLAKRQSDPLYFRQEYEADFVVFGDMVYCDYTTERNVVPSTMDLSNWRKYCTIDPGYRTCAMLWAAHNPYTDELVFYDEEIRGRLRHEEIVALLAEKEPPEGYAGIVSDVAGNAREGDTGLSVVSYIDNHEWTRRRKLYVSHHKQGCETGIHIVRSRIFNASGKATLKVMADRCPKLHKMHGLLEYDGSREAYLKDGVHDHPADAERYLAFHLDRTSGVARHTDW